MGAETVISLLGATLLVTGWAMWLLPVGSCRQCVHCQAEKLAKEREHDAQVGRIYGIPLCPDCGRHHPRGQGHQR